MVEFAPSAKAEGERELVRRFLVKPQEVSTEELIRAAWLLNPVQATLMSFIIDFCSAVGVDPREIDLNGVRDAFVLMGDGHL